MTTADQDWKTGPLNRSKYVIRKTCKMCSGRGEPPCDGDTNICMGRGQCADCKGQGSVPVDPNAAYFVLRIDGNHDPNARAALDHYAGMVEDDNPELAAGIWAWLDEAAVAAD